MTARRRDVGLFAPKAGKDAADHIAADCGIEDLVPVPLPASPGAVTVRLADVVPERVDWQWLGRLPLGKIVVLDGDPAVGKSTISVDVAARVSTGRVWPDGAPNRAGSVLLLSAEDGLADTIRPRLDAAGGNPANVHALTEIRYHDDHGQLRTRPVSLSDLEAIERAVKRTTAVLVVVDVLMAFLPGKIDSHRDQDIRGVLSGLTAMAERNGCCVLLLRHLNKSSGGPALYRGGGSIGIVGAARVGLLAAIDPDDMNRRVLAGIKSNLSAMPEALAYQLVDSPDHGCARVEWLGTSAHSAGALLAAPRDDDERTERDDAVEWLVDFLTDRGGEAPRRDVLKAARSEGHTERTLQRAHRGKVETARVGFPSSTVWRLILPPAAPPDPHHPERGATGQSGVTAETRGLEQAAGTQSRQSRHTHSAGTTDSAEEPSALCGHPLKVTNSTNGRCALCIVADIDLSKSDRSSGPALDTCQACGNPLLLPGRDMCERCRLDAERSAS